VSFHFSTKWRTLILGALFYLFFFFLGEIQEKVLKMKESVKYLTAWLLRLSKENCFSEFENENESFFPPPFFCYQLSSQKIVWQKKSPIQLKKTKKKNILSKSDRYKVANFRHRIIGLLRNLFSYNIGNFNNV
jgi:hypothetical protein